LKAHKFESSTKIFFVRERDKRLKLTNYGNKVLIFFVRERERLKLTIWQTNFFSFCVCVCERERERERERKVEAHNFQPKFFIFL
jgi:hypothetical protein